MPKLYCEFLILIIYVIVTNGYKIPRQTAPFPTPTHNNAAFEYKGPVFVIQETNGTSDLPFTGFIVNGGIEVVRPNIKSLVIQNTSSTVNINEPTPEFQEDPDYFAVYLTAENVAHAQFSRTSQITIPLTILLAALSSNMPRIMVLRKQNHFQYFNTLSMSQRPIVTVPLQIPPQRRRYQRDTRTPRSRIVVNDKSYKVVLDWSEETVNVQDICAKIDQELTYVNEMLQSIRNEKSKYDGWKYYRNATEFNNNNKDMIREENADEIVYKLNKKST